MALQCDLGSGIIFANPPLYRTFGGHRGGDASKGPPLPPACHRNSIRNTAMKHPSLRFAIIGGRSFGKTTLATSLMNIAGNTNGIIVVKGSTQAKLAIKNDELANIGQVSSTSWNDIQKVRFDIRSTQDERWSVSFKDYPGEVFEKYSDEGQVAALRGTAVKNKRTMDDSSAGKARRVLASLRRSDALIVLLPLNVEDQDYKTQLSVYPQKICAFLDRNRDSFRGIPVCLAINKWDLNTDAELTVEKLLADEDHPFGKFFRDLRNLVGDSLFCMAVSAFGKHKENDPDSKAEDAEPSNVFEMMIELARRTDGRKKNDLDSAWTNGSILEKTFVLPFTAAWAKMSGTSGQAMSDLFGKLMRDGFRKLGATVAGIAVLIGLCTLFVSGIAAFKTLSTIKTEAEGFIRVEMDDRPAIKKLRSRYGTESVFWRRLFGSSALQAVSRLEDRFNESVMSEWENGMAGADVHDGTFDTMHPTNRLARCEARLALTTNAVPALFETATNAENSRSRLSESVDAERRFKNDLIAHSGFDGEVYEKLGTESDPGTRARIMQDLLGKYKDDSTARPDEIERLQNALYKNQLAAGDELDDALSGLEKTLIGSDFESRLFHCRNMVARIDAMEPRFVGTNFVRFAERKESLLDDFFAVATNALDSAVPETAIEKTRRAKTRIDVCNQVADVWDASDSRSKFFDREKKKSQSEIGNLAIYVMWENDFATNVTATTAEEGRARQLATFLDEHRRYDYPDYANKWDAHNIEKSHLVSTLLADLDAFLESSLSGTTNDNAVLARESVSSRIARIKKVRLLLPPENERDANNRFEEEEKRFAEIQCYEDFDKAKEDLAKIPLPEKIPAIDRFVKEYPADKYTRRPDVFTQLETERKRLLDDVTNTFAKALSDNPDDTNATAVVRLANSERRIRAAEELLSRVPGSVLALKQLSDEQYITNKWTFYVTWDNDWETNIVSGAADEARRIEGFLAQHPKSTYLFYADKWDAAQARMNALATNEWNDLESHCATNPIAYSAGNLHECEIAATNRLKRIEIARTRLPTTYEEKLNGLKATVLNTLAAATGTSTLENEVNEVKTAPLETRLQAAQAFCRRRPAEQNRMIEIVTNATEEIENRFAAQLDTEQPSSTNFTESADYYMNRATALHAKAKYFPEDSDRRRKLDDEAEKSELERNKFGEWHNIQNQILDIKNKYSDDSLEKTEEAIRSLEVFDMYFTNKWTTADAIHSWFSERDTIRKKAEDLLVAFRKKELEKYGPMPPEDGNARKTWYEGRILVFEQFGPKFYRKGLKEEENTNQLKKENADFDNMKKRVEFDKGYATLQAELNRVKHDPSSCRKKISEFLKKFPKETYCGLSSIISSRYDSLERDDTRYAKQEKFANHKQQADQELSKCPKTNPEWESHRSELRDFLKKTEQYLETDSTKSEAEELVDKLNAAITECDIVLGPDSFKELEDREKKYKQQPTKQNFEDFNRAINKFDRESLSGTDKATFDNWKSALRDDSEVIGNLGKLLTEFYKNHDEASFNSLKQDYLGIIQGKPHTPLYADYNKYPFWADLTSFINSVRQDNVVFHCSMVKANLKEKENHEIKLTSLGQKKWERSDISKGDRQLPVDINLPASPTPLNIYHHADYGGKKTNPMFVDKFWIFGRGIKDNEVDFPSPAFQTGVHGSTIQFVFDRLPKLSIPEYKYEEKH